MPIFISMKYSNIIMIKLVKLVILFFHTQSCMNWTMLPWRTNTHYEFQAIQDVLCLIPVHIGSMVDWQDGTFGDMGLLKLGPCQRCLVHSCSFLLESNASMSPLGHMLSCNFFLTGLVLTLYSSYNTYQLSPLSNLILLHLA